MKNKLVLATMLLVAVVFVAAIGTSNVFAQGPFNTSPGSALFVDNLPHFIPPNTTLWYKFPYNGDRSTIEIKLFDGVTKQLQFNFYAPDQIGADFSFSDTPIGRGMPPSGSNDLQWKGLFYGPGIFFIQVINNTSTGQPFQLSVAGGGVTIIIPPPAPTFLPTRTSAPPPTPTINLLQAVMFPAIATLRAPAALTTTVPQTATIAATVEPTWPPIVIVVVTPTSVPAPVSTGVPVTAPTPVPTPVNDWWTNAYYVVNTRTQTIPGNSERWFIFDYAGDRSKIEIRIPGGNEMKLIFRLFTLDQVLRYQVDGRPIGEGTAGLVTCDTGRCVSNDLVWAGDFMMNGTYFIQVTNFEPTPKNYEISVIGGGVTLGR